MSAADHWEGEESGHDSSDGNYSSGEENDRGERDLGLKRKKPRLSSRRNDAKRSRGNGADISFVSSSSSASVAGGTKDSAPGGVTSQRAWKGVSESKGKKADKEDKEVGAWQKHTKGIGLKYLQKFGFKGRLGKEEDGISAPIEAVVHGANAGLGFGRKPRSTESLSNDSVLEVSAENNEYDGIGEDDRKDSAASIAKSHRWKKRVSHDNNSSAQASMSIIDMRSGEGTAIPSKLLGEELLHNLDLAYDNTLSDRALQEGKVKETRAKLSNLQLSIVDVKNHISAETSRCSKLDSILLSLRELGESRTSNASAVTTSSVNNIVCDLHRRFTDEFKVFGLISLLRLADAAIVELSSSWDPSLDQPAIKDIFKDWIDLAAHFREIGEASIADVVLGVVQEQCETLFLGSARDYFSTTMNMHFPETGIVLLRTLVDILGEDSGPVVDLLDVCIMPRLRKAINASNFSGQTSQPISSWILSWKSLLGSRMTELESDIRLRLIKTVDHCDTDFVEIRKHIAPWSNVLEEGSFKSLVLRNIMPKFICFMRNEVALSSIESASSQSSQSRDRLVAIFSMKKMVPKRHFDALMQGEFFPALFERLVAAVDSDPLCQAAFAGLVSLKESFGVQNLQDDQTSRYLFAAGFKMLDIAMSGSDKSALKTIAASLGGLDYFARIENAEISARLTAINR